MQGSELRALRKAAGLTQAEFGAELHLSGAFVGEMERGEKPIEPRTADLARARFAPRYDVAVFGDKFVVIEVKTLPGPMRVHRILTPTYDDAEAAETARKALAGGDYLFPYAASSTGSSPAT